MFDRAEIDLAGHIEGATISCKKGSAELLRPSQDGSYVCSRLNVDTGDADITLLHPRQVIDDDLDGRVSLEVDDVEIAPLLPEILQDQQTMATIGLSLAAEEDRGHDEQLAVDLLPDPSFGHKVDKCLLVRLPRHYFLLIGAKEVFRRCQKALMPIFRSAELTEKERQILALRKSGEL